ALPISPTRCVRRPSVTSPPGPPCPTRAGGSARATRPSRPATSSPEQLSTRRSEQLLQRLPHGRRPTRVGNEGSTHVLVADPHHCRCRDAHHRGGRGGGAGPHLDRCGDPGDLAHHVARGTRTKQGLTR